MAGLDVGPGGKEKRLFRQRLKKGRLCGKAAGVQDSMHSEAGWAAHVSGLSVCSFLRKCCWCADKSRRESTGV